MSLERDEFMRAMGETVLLPPGHPMRFSVEKAIAEAGPWAEQAWLDLLREDEQLRLDLRRVPIPAGLEARLLALPARREPARSLLSRRPWLARAAALAFILLGALLVLTVFRPRVEMRGRLQTAAMLAIHDHIHDRTVRIRTSAPAEFNEALSKALGFVVRLSPPAPGFVLLGGRQCTLGPHPIAYTLWKGPKGEYSFIQGRAADFGLPKNLAPVSVRPASSAAADLKSAALVWCKEGRLYLLVADEASQLPEVNP